jgi:putative membrane protein
MRAHPVASWLAAATCAAGLVIGLPMMAGAATTPTVTPTPTVTVKPTPTVTVTPTPTVTASWSVGTLSAQDSGFLVTAHQSNLSEIAAGGVASTRATSATVRSFAKRLVTDHTKLDTGVITLASTYGVVLPSSPSPDQATALQNVEANTGPAFDSAFVSMELAGHNAALASIEQELSAGQNSDVVAQARTEQPVVAAHLQMATELSGVSSSPPSAVSAGNGGQAAALVNDPAATALAMAGMGLVVLAGGRAGYRRRRLVPAGGGAAGSGGAAPARGGTTRAGDGAGGGPGVDR